MVHHLNGGGKHSRGDDATDGGAGLVRGIKRGKQRAHTLRALDDAQDNFRRDTERAFGTNENSSEVVAGGVESFSAEVDERAIGQNYFEAEDMRCGETVFEAMSATGIFRDIAADRANGLR